MEGRFKLKATFWMAVLAVPAAGALVACGGGGGGSATPPATHTVGGTVIGLGGTDLVLQNNGADSVRVPESGPFVFANSVAEGASYSVTVATQPAAPQQTCVVANGAGVVGASDVTAVTVTCTPSAFTALVNQPPDAGSLALLLTDGSVLMQSVSDAGLFFRLSPDNTGSYVNGTWRQVASPPAGYAPYSGSEVVLADGRVLFVGGEYNQNQYVLPFAPSGLTNMSAVYDPVADLWTMIAPPPGVAYIGDVPSVVLPDGSYLFGEKLGRSMWRLDPQTLTWASVPAIGKADDFAEEGWTLLPNGDLFTVDVGSPPHAEHYNLAASQWYSDGNTPVVLTSPSSSPGGLTYGPAPVQVVGGITYGPGPAGVYYPPGEVGPAMLLPNGTVFATGAASGGATAHTVIYTPGATSAVPGSFITGPDFANGDDAGDASAALAPSGHVLIATLSGRFYEFDGQTLKVAAVLPNNGGNTEYFLLPLPNGQLLVIGGVTQVYDSQGSADPSWAPSITTAPASVSRGTTYTISGTQFNGLSQAAAVGDEFNAATNYPLVRITNVASGHVAYARTHDHSGMGVATGSLVVSTRFEISPDTETGPSAMAVVANGIASVPVNITVN